MKRLALNISCALMVFHLAMGQTSLSFYHLGDATFQNGRYNPALVPTGKWFLGLPGLSGVHLHYNNRLSYSQVIAENPETGNPKIYPGRVLKNLGKNNLISTHVNVSLLHFGLRARNGFTYSFFVNERIESDFLFKKQVIKFGTRGNAVALDQKIQFGQTRFSLTHFREYGLGFSMPTAVEGITVGASLKYLQGFLNASTPESQKAYLATEGTSFDLTASLENGALRTAGRSMLENGEVSHFIFNGNRGVGLDVGFHWKLNSYYEVSASVVDLGFISWKEDLLNYTINDTSFTYRGLNLRQTGNIRNTVEDSILNTFTIREDQKAYTTLTSPKLYTSWIYHTRMKGGDVITSGGFRLVQGQLKSLFGVGYRQKLGESLVATANVTKLPQQFLNLGVALAVKGGPAQLYIAADQVYNPDMTKFQSFDFRFGINFIFGERKPPSLHSFGAQTTYDANDEKAKKRGPKYSQNQSFMGSRVKVKGHEGIYSVIPRQQRRKKEEFAPKPKKKKKNR